MRTFTVSMILCTTINLFSVFFFFNVINATQSLQLTAVFKVNFECKCNQTALLKIESFWCIVALLFLYKTFIRIHYVAFLLATRDIFYKNGKMTLQQMLQSFKSACAPFCNNLNDMVLLFSLKNKHSGRCYYCDA